jgi:hypothetical protein
MLTPNHPARQQAEAPPPVRNLRPAFDAAISPGKLRLTLIERMEIISRTIDRLSCTLVVAMGILTMTQCLSTFLIVALLRDSFVVDL